MTSCIVTVTINPALDTSTSVEHVVAERKLRCGPPRTEPGGGGVNVARAVHRLGGQAMALWSQGGCKGQRLADLLEREGICHRPLQIQGTTRESFVVYEESSGQQFRFSVPGPPFCDSDAARWLAALEQLEPVPDYLVISGSPPPQAPDDLYAQMAARLPDRCRLIVDTRGAPLRAVLNAGVFLIKPNLRELDELAGEPFTGEADIKERARAIVEQGQAQVVVVSRGSGGALLVDADQVRQLRAPSVPIRSKVGAGDSMVGGIVLSLARGKRVTEAAAMGVAAGAAAVMTPGSELCRRSDAERLYGEILSEL